MARRKTGNPPGQPTALTPETQARILKIAQLGTPRRLQASYAGITRQALNLWLKKGREDPESEPWGRFFARHQEAEAEGEVALLARIHKGAEKDWRAAAHLLAVRHPKDYAKQRIVRADLLPPGSPPESGSSPSRDPRSFALRLEIIEPKPSDEEGEA